MKYLGLTIGLIVHTVTHLTFYLFFYILYHFEFPFFEQYKAIPQPWPWYSDKEWPQFLRKSCLLFAFNNIIAISVWYYFLVRVVNVPFVMQEDAESLPSPTGLLAQLVFCMMCEDLTFHFSHRMLHHKSIYPYIHKIHHQHRVTVSIAAEYAHPLEFVFGNLVPAAIGQALLGHRTHIAVTFAWNFVRSAESIEGHCGYEFPWSPFRLLPFGSDYGYHAYHHSHNIGNYSSFFTIWDTVFNSNKTYYK